jgi:hypothetical protein
VVILIQDLAWRGLGNRVDECLAILVEGLRLDRHEQVLEKSLG